MKEPKCNYENVKVGAIYRTDYIDKDKNIYAMVIGLDKGKGLVYYNNTSCSSELFKFLFPIKT